MEHENARKTIAQVAENVTQKSSSRKDEIIVMKAMMNDQNFSVDVYDKTGKCGDYYPAREVRKMVSKVISETTRIPAKEASELVDNYEFTKADASAMVNISKEFFNTYLKETGRKISLGGRATSDIELMWKEIADRTVEIPSKDGTRIQTFIPAHSGIKTMCPCPEWIVNKEKK